MKTARIITVAFDKVWEAPDKSIMYFHKLALSNGEVGNVGCSDKVPAKKSQGVEIDYEIKGNRIKLLTQSHPATQETRNWEASDVPTAHKQAKNFKKPPETQEKSTTGVKKNYGYDLRPDNFLGYCAGYAKDMVIAGKTKPKDIEDFKNILTKTYEHVCELLVRDMENTENPF